MSWLLCSSLAWALDTEAFLERALELDTDALVIAQDGQEVLRWERRPGLRMNTHSVTKSITALALAQLVEAGELAWDDSLGEHLSAWAEDPRGAITVDQVLHHTSGLQPERSPLPLWPFQHALKQDLEHAPGERYAYSNTAPNLLSGVVEARTGESLAANLQAGVFDPLGIAQPSWGPHFGPTPAWSELRLSADELLAIGQALLDGQLLSEETLDQLTLPSRSPWVTRLWWPVYAVHFTLERDSLDLLVAHGLPRDHAERLLPLVDRPFSSWTEAWEAVGEEVSTTELHFTGVQPFTTVRHHLGFQASGWAGQHLVVLPEAGVVAVRQRRASFERERDERVWTSFPMDVVDLLELREELTRGPPATWSEEPPPEPPRGP